MTRQVELKPLTSSHVQLVFDLFNDPQIYDHTFLTNAFPVSDLSIKKKVESWLNASNQKHFVIVGEQDQEFGIAQIYEISTTNRKCSLGIILASNYNSKGIGTEVIEQLISFCFNKLNLHKIEVSITESNVKSINLVKKFDFSHEGTLKESAFKNGKYESILMFGLIND